MCELDLYCPKNKCPDDVKRMGQITWTALFGGRPGVKGIIRFMTEGISKFWETVVL